MNAHDPVHVTADGVRLDQWLWAARFYKTRALAKNAIERGQVLVAGQTCKPARVIRRGETVFIDKHGAQVFEVVVVLCEKKRASAPVARSFYEETPTSIARRAQLAQTLQTAREMVQFPSRRPEKHQRRQLRALRHQDFSS